MMKTSLRYVLQVFILVMSFALSIGSNLRSQSNKHVNQIRSLESDVEVPRILHSIIFDSPLQAYMAEIVKYTGKQAEFQDFRHVIWTDESADTLIEEYDANGFQGIAQTWELMKNDTGSSRYTKMVNFFRIVVLYAEGGIYFNADVLTCGSLKFMVDTPGTMSFPFYEQNSHEFDFSMSSSPPHHRLLELAIHAVIKEGGEIDELSNAAMWTIGETYFQEKGIDFESVEENLYHENDLYERGLHEGIDQFWNLKIADVQFGNLLQQNRGLYRVEFKSSIQIVQTPAECFDKPEAIEPFLDYYCDRDDDREYLLGHFHLDCDKSNLELVVKAHSTSLKTSKTDISAQLDVLPTTISSLPTDISMLDENFSFRKNQDLSIVFMGDSLLLYQYLSLVKYLKDSEWIDPELKVNNPVLSDSFDGWADNHFKTNAMLEPYENCDCYHNDGAFQWKYMEYITENHFYFDKGNKNNNIGYVQKLGDIDAKWSWKPNKVHEGSYKHNGIKTDMSQVHHIGRGDWITTIRDFISQIKPKYQVIVFNAGFWPHNLHDEDAQTEIIDAIRESGMISVYRTTTKRKHENNVMVADYEKSLCRKADLCLDTSWTGRVPSTLYHDSFHFQEPIYRMLNTQLLGLLETNSWKIVKPSRPLPPPPPPPTETISISEQTKHVTMFEETFSFKKTRDLSIVFMGDSMSRFQYLSLVTYLRTGSWIDPDREVDNPVVTDSFEGWEDGYMKTNTVFAPYENCDCYRNEGVFDWKYIDYATENRFYLDTENNNNIGFVQKLGKIDSRWSFNPDQVHEDIYVNNGIKNDRSQVHHVGNGNWTTAIREFVSQIAPKYEVIVFNAGLWPNELSDEALQLEIIEAIRESGMKSVYKTTTKRQNEDNTKMSEYEKRMCAKVDICMDITWTGKVTPEYYWDRLHFHEPIYRLLNTQLLGLLETSLEKEGASSSQSSPAAPPPVLSPSEQKKQISMYNQSFSFEKDGDFNILFMGDTLSAFQYLSLATYLRTGDWIDPKLQFNNPIFPRSFKGWQDGYRKTNELFAPYENCDCFRNEGAYQVKYLKYATENRFYLDKEKNNNIGYIQKFGKNDAKWSWSPDQVHEKIYENNGVMSDMSEVKHIGNGNWTTVINEYISKIAPKYEVIVLNSGFWPDFFMIDSYQTDIIDAIREHKIISVYRTTTKPQMDNSTEVIEYERRMCEKADICMDTSWTGNVPEDMYQDGFHFHEPIYRMLNTQLLGLLETQGNSMGWQLW